MQPRDRHLPVLWLFTDARLAAPGDALLSLPCRPAFRFLFGVVIRGRDAGERAALAERLAPICRARGIAMLVAGDPRLAHRLGAGSHLSSRHPVAGRPVAGRPVSAAVHDRSDLVAAGRRGARLCFVSPVFRTASHAGARPLGPHRYARLARDCRRAGMVPAALGGIDGRTVRALAPATVSAAGAISALSEAHDRTGPVR